ncbi:MAG: class I SAM-dependent methyltransferase [Gemmatimonadaceae bacterium]
MTARDIFSPSSMLPDKAYPEWLAYEPKLLPPPSLMREEGITILEEWFRWGEEWSMLLRTYGKLTPTSDVLEIGCGLGRIAFAIRYLLPRGTYTGFEIVRQKVEFLQPTFTPAHRNFSFVWADVANTYYNPGGTLNPVQYHFPAAEASKDLVFAASVFTHMAPAHTAHYLREAARVLKPGGRCVLSFFLLERYRHDVARPFNFGGAAFAFDLHDPVWGSAFAFVNADNPEQMTSYRTSLIDRLAWEAGLKIDEVIPGLWSGTEPAAAPTQDVVVLSRAP